MVVFYNAASIVINLTNPQLAVETFGLTTLEAMSAALPVIVPTVGGIAEMVEDDINGYKTDVRVLDVIQEQIKNMLNDKYLYLSLAKAALKSSEKYKFSESLPLLMELIEDGKRQHKNIVQTNGCI